MDWFKRASRGLVSQKRKDMPDLWVKCTSCNEILYKPDWEKNCSVCLKCGFHFRLPARGYLRCLLDDNSFKEFNADLAPLDVLKFKGNKRYSDQIKEAAKKTGVNDAVITGFGELAGRRLVMAVMDFSFIGGSMGSVVGEKIALACDEALRGRLPLVIISASGGARMMEGALSLMQMAKTSARLARLADAGLP
jgi:acetyl-CoA carboxylase carboxyl transferase subunit beta